MYVCVCVYVCEEVLSSDGVALCVCLCKCLCLATVSLRVCVVIV
jgi:hypothetical protein